MADAVIRSRLPVDDIANDLLAKLGVTDIDWVIVDPLSIGDAYQTLCLLKAFRAKNLQPGARLFYICSDRVAPLAPMFGAVDVLVAHRLDYNICYLFAQTYRLGPGVPIVVGPSMYADGWLQRLLDHGLVSVLHVRKLILGLDLGCPISHGVPQEADRRAAAEIAAGAGVEPGKSLLIVNHATTMKPLPPEAFAGVVERFPGPVFTDASVAGATVIPGTRPIGIPIAQMIPMAELFGQVLALRSGIVDLLSDADAELFSIYPRPMDAQTWVKDQAAWVNAYRNLTLGQAQLAGRVRERPILLEPEDGAEEISGRILARFADCGLLK